MANDGRRIRITIGVYDCCIVIVFLASHLSLLMGETQVRLGRLGRPGRFEWAEWLNGNGGMGGAKQERREMLK